MRQLTFGALLMLLVVGAAHVAEPDQETAEPPPRAWLRAGLADVWDTVAPWPAAVEAKRMLDSVAGAPWNIHWNKHTGTVEGMWGPTEHPFGNSPQEAAETFAREFRPLFTGLSPENDKGEIEFRAGRPSMLTAQEYSVGFGQYYKGIPVEGATMHVRVRPDGQVLAAGGKTKRIEGLDVVPKLTVLEALSALRRHVAPDSVETYPEIEGELRVLVTTDGPHLAWSIPNIGVGPCGPYTFLIDAFSGDVLGRRAQFTDPLPECSPYPPAKRRDSPSADSAVRPAPAKRPLLKPRPIQKLSPQEIENLPTAPHSPTGSPRDTTNPQAATGTSHSPSSDGAGRRASPARQHVKAESAANPEYTAWFFYAGYATDIQSDFDSDTCDGRAYLEWDIDTDQEWLEIRVAIYGRDAEGQVVLLKQNLPYAIEGNDYDDHWTDIRVPWRSEWDFRIAVSDTLGDTLVVLEYGASPTYGGIPLDICMERRQEDAVFVNLTNDPPGRVLPTDWDNNGYYQNISLLFKIKVQYDSTYFLFVDFYARDASSNEV